MTISRNARHKVLITSYLEPELVDVICAVDDRLEVIWEPDLLPVPRYVADHTGTARNLDETQLNRWRSLLSEAEICFDFDWWEPSRLAENAPRLRWVQATSSGIGETHRRLGFDQRTEITFTTAAGVHADPLGEFALLGLLWIIRDVPMLTGRQAARTWQRYTARTLAGQRVVIVGLGNVGRRVAELCSAAKMEVWGAVRPGHEQDLDTVARWVSVDQLVDALRDTDALVLACPLTEETHQLIGANELAALPAHAALVNVARGAVIDEPELIRVLEQGRIAGAVLDVVEREPLDPDSPLWDMPNVLISPHSASTAAQENAQIVGIFTENLKRYLDRRSLINEYDSVRTY